MTIQTGGSALRFGFPAGAGVCHPARDALPLADRVAAKILAQQARSAPARDFVYFSGRWMSYGESDERANRAANALARLGVVKGTRVALLLRNRFEFLDLWFGLSRLGAIEVPLNPEYRAAQLLHVFRRAPIAVVVVEGSLLAELEIALKGVQVQPAIVMIDLEGGGARGDFIDYATILASASGECPCEAALVSGRDVGAVMNTSGTTGASKGVCLPHAQQYILGRTIAADVDLQEHDIYYNFFPLFHNTAQAMITVPVLLAGARMVLTDRFSASRFWPEVIEHGCTAFYYIGEIMHILLKSTTREDAQGSRLRVGWGIGADPRDCKLFKERFGVDLHAGYGSTEANVPCVLPHATDKVNSVGKLVPGFEIRIANEEGEPVPAGTQGEILVRSTEPYATMAGYDGDAPATVASWQQLWLHTGDAAVLDEDGYFYFKGRVKDSIRVKGENISAFEVEQAISELDGVVEVAAIAVPCELGGDDLKIVVVRRPGATLDAQALIRHAQSCLPRYSVPRYVEFVDELPKTPTNKIQKHILRLEPFSPSTWDRNRDSRA